MGISSIINIYIEVWTQINEMPQGNYLLSFEKPTIRRQRPFELTDIEYGQIKYEFLGLNL